MGNFANKAIVAFLVGIALLFACPCHVLGQTTWTTTSTAFVDVSNGTPTNLSPFPVGVSTVDGNDKLEFGDAGHTLTITDDGEIGTITPIGTVTTVRGGGGTLIFDLRNDATQLSIGDIGTNNRRVTAVNVRNSGNRLTVGNVFAGTLNVNSDQILTAAEIDIDTITNSGTFTAVAINAETLTNTVNGTLTTDAIDAEKLENYGKLTAYESIATGTLTNRGELTTGTIDAGILNNIGTLDAETIVVETLSNSGTLTSNRQIDARELANDGNLTAGAISAETLINNGALTITNGTEKSTVVSLVGSGDIIGAGDLTIINTTSSGFNGNITSTNLTVSQGSFGGDITITGDFTANLNDDLEIKNPLTVGGNATFAGNGRAKLVEIEITGSTTISDDATVIIDIANSKFSASGNSNNGTLKIYGESVDPRRIQFDGTGNFKNIAIFTDWQWENNANIVNTGIRDQAYMSDGYLAAFTVHHRYTAWNMVRDRLISGNNVDFCKSGWINYTGRSNTYNSSFNNREWKTFTHGGQIGIDFLKTPRFQSGLLFGGEGSQSRNKKDLLESEDFYFGLYGAHIFRHGTDARIVFAQGWQSYDLKRIGNGGTPYTSSFGGWTSEANFELGKRIGWGDCTMRPVLAADVYNNNLKSAQEAGKGDDRITYSKTNLTQVFLRTGTDFRHKTNVYTFNSGIYYAYDVNGAELNTRVTSVNDSTLSAPLVGTKLGRNLLMFNFGVEGEIDTNFSLICGYTGEYIIGSAKDAIQSIGHVGFVGKW